MYICLVYYPIVVTITSTAGQHTCTTEDAAATALNTNDTVYIPNKAWQLQPVVDAQSIDAVNPMGNTPIRASSEHELVRAQIGRNAKGWIAVSVTRI